MTYSLDLLEMEKMADELKTETENLNPEQSMSSTGLEDDLGKLLGQETLLPKLGSIDLERELDAKSELVRLRCEFSSSGTSWAVQQ